MLAVIARDLASEAIQSAFAEVILDCFAALAMTVLKQRRGTSIEFAATPCSWQLLRHEKTRGGFLRAGLTNFR